MSAMENHWGKAMGKFEGIPQPPSPRLISDGFGFSWPFGRKRRARLAASIARQQELDAFWKAEPKDQIPVTIPYPWGWVAIPSAIAVAIAMAKFVWIPLIFG